MVRQVCTDPDLAALVASLGAIAFIERVPQAGYLLFGAGGLIGSFVWGVRLLRPKEDYIQEDDKWRLVAVRRSISEVYIGLGK